MLGEYSGLNNELKLALIKAGHDVTLAAACDFFKNFKTDINLGYGSTIYSYKMRQFLLPLLNLSKFSGFDVVHVINFYIIPRLPFLNLFLIKFLKENNGLVTLSGAGDDPFYVKYSERAMRYSPIPSHELIDRQGRPYYMRKQAHLDAMHKYMNYIDAVIPIIFEFHATFCAAGYSEKTLKPIPIPIDTKKIEFSENRVSNGKVVFFHGLNRRGFKGTFLIEKSFQELEKKYPKDVECIIDGNLPFDRYLALLSIMNVNLDQVFSYSLAMNSLYSMAQGKVVCGGAEQESTVLYDGVLPPVYNLIPDQAQITEVLETVLERRDQLASHSEMSRAFVERYHNPEVVANLYLKSWLSLLARKVQLAKDDKGDQ
ncbi:glycosyltransferase [Simiduia litorea]